MKSKTYPLLKKSWIRSIPENRLHQCSIPIIALTGGIASGKSTVAKLFQKKGIKVIDADSLVKEIYGQKNSLNFVQKECPEAVTKGEINFNILRQEIFSKNKSREKFESFIYQRLPEKFLDKLSPEDSFIIYDIPLLFEKGLDSLVDVKILAYTTPQIQLERLMKRDSISRSLAKKMLSLQWPIKKKKTKVDLVIDNSSNKEELVCSFEEVFKRLFTH